MKSFWRNWLALSKRLVYFQTGILLTVIYFIIIIPLSFTLQKVARNALLGHSFVKRKNTQWNKRSEVKHDITWAREQ